MKKKSVKTLLRVLLILLLTVLLLAAGYVAYVFLSYSRIDDNEELSVSGTAPADTVAVGTTYTAVSQNLGFGAYTPEFTFFMDGGTQSWGESRESVIACIDAGITTIKGLNPDFVLLQEVDTDSTRSYHVDQAKQATDAFDGFCSAFAVNYHSAFLLYPFYQPHGSSNSGILTLADVNATSSLRRKLPISGSVSKLLDLDRCYSVTRFPTDNGHEFVLYNVHLSAYGGSPEIRTGQMTMLLSDMQSEYEKGNYCLCGGDFNHDFTGNSTQVINHSDTTDFGWAQPFPEELLPENVSRATDYSSGSVLPTCRNCDVPYVKGNFTIIVDGFLVSDNVSVSFLENVQTDFTYSDHNPVLIRFSLDAGE